MNVKLNGEMAYLWHAFDQKGEILETYITKTRDKDAALTFMKKVLKRQDRHEAISRSLPDRSRFLGGRLRSNDMMNWAWAELGFRGVGGDRPALEAWIEWVGSRPAVTWAQEIAEHSCGQLRVGSEVAAA